MHTLILTFGFLVLCMIIGLVLLLAPLPGQWSRLNEIGKWIFVLAFAKWLGF